MAGRETGPLDVRFEGSEAGDRLQLQVRDADTGIWRTVVESNRGRVRRRTALGRLRAGQELELKLVNLSQGKEYLSSSGMARVDAR
ncbi:MAG: hypothetical protein AAFX50_22735, partial [Acidobacteriota bacterium]